MCLYLVQVSGDACYGSLKEVPEKVMEEGMMGMFFKIEGPIDDRVNVVKTTEAISEDSVGSSAMRW